MAARFGSSERAFRRNAASLVARVEDDGILDGKPERFTTFRWPELRDRLLRGRDDALDLPAEPMRDRRLSRAELHRRVGSFVQPRRSWRAHTWTEFCGPVDTAPARLLPPSPMTLRVWRRRLVEDLALTKVSSIIDVRQHDLRLLVDQVDTSPLSEAESRPELTRRLEEAKALMVEQQAPDDEDSAYDLLYKLDGIVPLIADDRQLLLMLESELDRSDSTYGTATRARAVRLLEYTPDRTTASAWRRELETLVTSALRARNDAEREARIANDLRQNYLTWLGLVLLLLLVATSLAALAAVHSGLWADVLLAILAGALGGTLSGVIALRTPETRIAALKNRGLVMLVQPVFGGVAGIIVFAIWRTGAITIAGLKDTHSWAAIAVVAFAGGFSEPFFLKSVARVTGAVEQPRNGARAT
jgi:hypothetical protein